MDVLRSTRRCGQVSQCRGVHSGYVGYVVEVDILDEIAILHTVFNANILVLMVKVFAPLRNADRSKTFEVEAGVISTTQKAIAAEDERSEEHTSELQSHLNLVCRLLLEKKKHKDDTITNSHN